MVWPPTKAQNSRRRAPQLGVLWDRLEMARYCGVALKTTYGPLWASMPAIRVNARCTRFDPDAVKAWLASRKANTPVHVRAMRPKKAKP